MPWKSDIQPATTVDMRHLIEWLSRNFRTLHRYTMTLDETLAGFGEIVTIGALITDNAGDGTVEGDLNATDFTGHPHVDPTTGTALLIAANNIVTFGHKSVAYSWIGPSNVTVGLNGVYTALATDLIPIGTADHNLLTNREAANQHPMSSVTGLQADQTRQDNNLNAHTTATSDAHPMAAITGLVPDQQRQDNDLNTHIGDANNPHQVNHSQLPDVDPDPDDPHQQYSRKYPGLLLGGTYDNFTLNTTDSKVQNYDLSAQWNWPNDDGIDPANGNITIPTDGIYRFTTTVLGYQGNDTKEEWIELRLDLVGGAVRPPGRTWIAEREVPTDKTNIRQVTATFTRPAYVGEVYSLWMWASAGLGTFTSEGSTFEITMIAEVGELAP